METTTYQAKRILPDDAEAAYLETGLTPETGEYLIPSPWRVECACGIGVMVCHALGVKKGGGLPRSVKISTLLGITKKYLYGFTLGFDKSRFDRREPTEDDPEVLAGFRDGLACGERVFTP